MGPALRLQGVGKRYGGQVVFGGLTAELPGGLALAVVGRSGTGKSTLLNLLSGLDQPSSGQVWLGEVEVTGLDEQARTLLRRRQIGFVFQFFNLLPTLTAQENAALPLVLLGQGEAAALERAAERLRDLGLGERLRAFPDQLSGGEQQRVAIARAVIHLPKLLLADEPTGNLDQETGRQVLDLLLGVSREQGQTLLVATHSDELAKRADQVWRLSREGLQRTGV